MRAILLILLLFVERLQSPNATPRIESQRAEEGVHVEEAVRGEVEGGVAGGD